jgi:hypothetical protein
MVQVVSARKRQGGSDVRIPATRNKSVETMLQRDEVTLGPLKASDEVGAPSAAHAPLSHN